MALKFVAAVGFVAALLAFGAAPASADTGVSRNWSTVEPQARTVVRYTVVPRIRRVHRVVRYVSYRRYHRHARFIVVPRARYRWRTATVRLRHVVYHHRRAYWRVRI